jgi:hypothetical protein
MGSLDTVGKVWGLILAVGLVIGFIVGSTWAARGVYEQLKDNEEAINYVDQRHDRKLDNHINEYHRNDGN